MRRRLPLRPLCPCYWGSLSKFPNRRAGYLLMQCYGRCKGWFLIPRHNVGPMPKFCTYECAELGEYERGQR